MSAARPSSRDTREDAARGAASRPRDISTLHARRREANRRRRLVRVDLGLGVFVALVLLIATPGLAIAAIFAGLILVAIAGSVFLQRRAERRRRAPESSEDGRRIEELDTARPGVVRAARSRVR